MATVRAFTLEDYLALPDDEWRYELIEGALLQMPLAGEEHGAIESELHGRLWLHLREHPVGKVYPGDTGFLLADDPPTLVGPDIAFVAKDRLPSSRSRGFLSIAPDLVVEIVSPNDRVMTVLEKVALYLTHGVRVVWVIWPSSRTVTVYLEGRDPLTLTATDTLTGGDVLPGFAMVVDDLFA